jgi:hypothetical protein
MQPEPTQRSRAGDSDRQEMSDHTVWIWLGLGKIFAETLHFRLGLNYLEVTSLAKWEMSA